MKKIVINSDYGGFGLSDAAMERYGELKGLSFVRQGSANIWSGADFYVDVVSDETYFSSREIERDDKALVQVVEELGEDVNGFAAKLKVVEIPDDVDWQIDEYDGSEWVAEKHRKWG